MPLAEPSFSRRSFLRAGSGAAVGLGLTAVGCGRLRQPVQKAGEEKASIDAKIDGDLILFNWVDYIAPAILTGFQKKYDVKVIKSHYRSMEDMETKLDAGYQYDIIFPTAKWSERLMQKNLLRRIDHSQLGNAAAIFDVYTYFSDPWYDPDSKHTVPYTMYKTGIGWRKDKLGDKLTGSWDDLWNADAKGKLFLLDDPDEVLAIGALKHNLDLSTTDEDDLERITKTLRSLRPHVRGFSDDEYYYNLLNGSAVMAQAYNGEMAAVFSEAEDPSVFGFEVPKEGSPINSDCFAIPSNARHPGTAMLFIDYMLRPENVKKNIEYIGYPMPVFGSESTYAALVEPFPECVISAAELADSFYFRNHDAEGERARDAAWKRVKAA